MCKKHFILCIIVQKILHIRPWRDLILEPQVIHPWLMSGELIVPEDPDRLAGFHLVGARGDEVDIDRLDVPDLGF